MTAVRWPNRLGWDVSTPEGTAEVRDMVSHLRAFAPIPPHREWLEVERRYRVTAMYRVCDVPLSTNPVEAIRECLARGLVRDGYSAAESFGPVPFLTLTAPLPGLEAA